ncbi:hypothetical protein EIN_495690 [Entamoeba invadens IP1]|uniref:Uncharacterized protein n=1 Tax=Entamoeba invadens IP1 TaxID=370355 RepID=A0A0A1TZR5_ENTIV|nr:hypothetical protein EIN_495690 [Entamoeba invadens IP1]ELP87104.1 hypothetical protein EIN_495690 [Entamoeba invadens IP1]|eukprot:XP_004253875.1 hypothetical protein EIN_495690 [Entamoeba invadens IP1]
MCSNTEYIETSNNTLLKRESETNNRLYLQGAEYVTMMEYGLSFVIACNSRTRQTQDGRQLTKRFRVTRLYNVYGELLFTEDKPTGITIDDSFHPIPEEEGAATEKSATNGNIYVLNFINKLLLDITQRNGFKNVKICETKKNTIPGGMLNFVPYHDSNSNIWNLLSRNEFIAQVCQKIHTFCEDVFEQEFSNVAKTHRRILLCYDPAQEIIARSNTVTSKIKEDCIVVLLSRIQNMLNLTQQTVAQTLQQIDYTPAPTEMSTQMVFNPNPEDGQMMYNETNTFEPNLDNVFYPQIDYTQPFNSFYNGEYIEEFPQNLNGFQSF